MAAMASILDFRLGPFKLIFIYKLPQCVLPSFESVGLSVQEEKRKIDFQDGRLEFRSYNFSYFWSSSLLDASYQISRQLAFWFRRRSEK